MPHPKKIKGPKKEIAELTATLKQVQADFENYKKRVEREKQEFVNFAEAQLIERMLPFVDSFESAIEKLDKSAELKGIELLKKQFDDFLDKEGMQKIDCLGKKFDPLYCEALLEENNKNKDDMIVLEEIQKGYLFKDRVLRPAKVKVNKLGEEKKKVM